MNNPLSNDSSSSNLPMFNMGSIYRKNTISNNANATIDKMEEFFKFIKNYKAEKPIEANSNKSLPIGQIRRCIMLPCLDLIMEMINRILIRYLKEKIIQNIIHLI